MYICVYPCVHVRRITIKRLPAAQIWFFITVQSNKNVGDLRAPERLGVGSGICLELVNGQLSELVGFRFSGLD